MKKFLIYLLAIFVIIPLALVTYINDSTTVKQKIDNQNYIIVTLPNNANKYYVDLKAKRFYGGSGEAVYEDITYSYNLPYYSKSKKYGFNNFKDDDILYPIIADSTSVFKVKRSNYIIEKKITSPKYKDLLLGSGYVEDRIKIYYNRQCLPIKVKFMDWKTKKWVTDTNYSYYQTSHTEYRKQWNNFVKRIKSGEFDEG